MERPQIILACAIHAWLIIPISADAHIQTALTSTVRQDKTISNRLHDQKLQEPVHEMKCVLTFPTSAVAVNFQPQSSLDWSVLHCTKALFDKPRANGSDINHYKSSGLGKFSQVSFPSFIWNKVTVALRKN